jgi:hypothetical protein
MKQLVDIHTLLSTYEDMDDLHDDPDAASEKLNTVLHMVYDNCDEDIASDILENMITYSWEHWHLDTQLAEIEVDDLVDWVDHLLNTWDNEEYLEQQI